MEKVKYAEVKDLPKEEIKEKYSEEICKVCLWTTEGNHHPESVCEGCCCNEAIEKWLDELFLQENPGERVIKVNVKVTAEFAEHFNKILALKHAYNGADNDQTIDSIDIPVTNDVLGRLMINNGDETSGPWAEPVLFVNGKEVWFGDPCGSSLTNETFYFLDDDNATIYEVRFIIWPLIADLFEANDQRECYSLADRPKEAVKVLKEYDVFLDSGVSVSATNEKEAIQLAIKQLLHLLETDSEHLVFLIEETE